jgi:hypothetical protein
MYSYPKRIFADESGISDSLTCAGCQQVTLNFVIDECGHSFGKFCCANIKFCEGKCPISGYELTSAPVDYHESTSVTIIKREVKCPLGPRCDWKGKFEDLDSHLNEDCEENKGCSNTSCTVTCMCESNSFYLIREERIENNDSLMSLEDMNRLAGTLNKKVKSNAQSNSENRIKRVLKSIASRTSDLIAKIFTKKIGTSSVRKAFKAFGISILILLIAYLFYQKKMDVNLIFKSSDQSPSNEWDEQSFENENEVISKLKFDKSLTGEMIYVDGNSAKFLANGKLILLNATITSSPTFTFKILEKKSQEFAIGCCSKSKAENSNYHFEKNSDAKMNFFLFRTYTTNPHLDKADELKQIPRGHLRMNNNDEIEIKLNKKIRSIMVFNLSTGIETEIPLGRFTNLKDLYPCIYFGITGEAVELVSPLKIGNSEINFNLGTFQASQFKINNNVISFTYAHKAQFALIEEPFRLNKIYKFFIDGPTDSITAVGVCSKKITTENKFLYTFDRTDNGAYIFHSSPWVSVHGKYSWNKKDELRTEISFFENNELSLKYNPHLMTFELKNESWMLSTSFKIESPLKETNDLRICVLLNRNGEEISVETN